MYVALALIFMAIFGWLMGATFGFVALLVTIPASILVGVISAHVQMRRVK